MKKKFRSALLLTLALALIFILSACGAAVDQDSIAIDQQESAESAETATTVDESEDESSGGLFSGSGAAAAYSGPRTKVGQFFAGWFAKLFEWLYLFTYKIGLPNWILTVFLFTLIIRLLMQPLMGKQMRSSRKMQLLKPELDEIRQRYASNPQKQNEATAALYKENDCSPTAGCLPLLIQMPILIWLFAAIRTYDPLSSTYEVIVNSNFSFMWIDNLAEADPTGWALPLLVALATLAQQWVTTADRTDRTQRMMMIMMPAMFFFFARSFPALMCFYWIFYSLVSTGIMLPFMRKWEKEDRRKIEETRLAKEAEAERRRQKKAAAREAYQQKKKAKQAKKPAYEVQEGDLKEQEEEEEEAPEWDPDEEFEYDPDADLEENFRHYLVCNHIKIKEKKMKLHPYSVEAELVKLAYDPQGKELDYDKLKQTFTNQYQKQASVEAVANSRLGKFLGLDKRVKAEQEAAEAAARAAVSGEDADQEDQEDQAEQADQAAEALQDGAEQPSSEE